MEVRSLGTLGRVCLLLLEPRVQFHRALCGCNVTKLLAQGLNTLFGRGQEVFSVEDRDEEEAVPRGIASPASAPHL